MYYCISWLQLLCAFLEFDLFPDPDSAYGNISGGLELLSGPREAGTETVDVAPSTNEANVQAMKDIRMQLVTTLQSTDVGKKAYVRVCDKKIELHEFVSTQMYY